MATISRDFGEIVIDAASGGVRVDGTTRDDDGGPLPTDPASQLCISIIGLPDGPRAVEVEIPAPAGWSAHFENACPPVHPDNEVHVVGVALQPGTAPYVWEAMLNTSVRGDLPIEPPVDG